ncbi:MAG: DUF551 domain-containing protein [Oscillospiraceae bacterium]|nr:DUF551 domain-containing protein [Oscillospiraceae bacterium]
MTNNWIPVSEKLPKKSGEYLIQRFYQNNPKHRKPEIYIAIFSVAHRAFNTADWMSEAEAESVASSDVVAWMPLPAPYQKENGGML